MGVGDVCCIHRCAVYFICTSRPDTKLHKLPFQRPAAFRCQRPLSFRPGLFTGRVKFYEQPRDCFILADKVLYPSSAAYNTSLQSYWSKQEQQIAPWCIVWPAVTEDVFTVVKTLTTGNLSCKFVVRSGGHTAQAGSANIGRGVTIDMSAFNDIVLSADRTLVTIGSGERWENVYAALGSLGFVVPGGRAAEVGVGGLLLGDQ